MALGKDLMTASVGLFGIGCATWFFADRRRLFVRTFRRDFRTEQEVHRIPEGAALKKSGRFIAILEFGMALAVFLVGLVLWLRG